MPEGQLLADSARLLAGVIDVDELGAAARAGRVVCCGALVWSAHGYDVETRVATHLRRLGDTAARWSAMPSMAGGLLAEQQHAITSVWEHGVTVVVGKAGSYVSRRAITPASGAARLGCTSGPGVPG